MPQIHVHTNTYSCHPEGPDGLVGPGHGNNSDPGIQNIVTVTPSTLIVQLRICKSSDVGPHLEAVCQG